MARRLARVLLRDETVPFTAVWVGAGPATGGGMGFFFDPLTWDAASNSYAYAGPRMFKSAHEVTNVAFFDVD